MYIQYEPNHLLSFHVLSPEQFMIYYESHEENVIYSYKASCTLARAILSTIHNLKFRHDVLQGY